MGRSSALDRTSGAYIARVLRHVYVRGVSERIRSTTRIWELDTQARLLRVRPNMTSKFPLKNNSRGPKLQV